MFFMNKYVSLLRGINVGGHKRVPMADLRKLLEKHGYKNVKTVLASGNVVYESDEGKIGQIGEILEKAFGFNIPVITIPFEAIEEIVASDPFGEVKVTPRMKLYVTFLKNKPEVKIQLPYVSADDSFKIPGITENAIFSYVDLEKTGTLDAMDFLEKEFGKELTTRNYNTVVKIAGL